MLSITKHNDKKKKIERFKLIYVIHNIGLFKLFTKGKYIYQ